MHFLVFIAVTAAPSSLQITPRQPTYEPGDRIQCSAEGNPEPSYQWTDLINGTVIQGSVLVVSDDMVGKDHTFQCTATNEFNSTSITLNFIVTGINTFNILTLCCFI